jgi:Ca2+-binding EF-hand superfamily protein
MASKFQRQKVTGLFQALDADGDGYLDEQDFRSLTDRWLQVRRGLPGSPAHVQLSAIMMGWWATLLAASDQDRDHRVTLDEVMVVVDLLRDMAEAVATTANAMFDAVDEDGDDRVSPREYRRMIEAWRGRATDTDEVFPLLDRDADGYLSRTEFAGLWFEFWTGDNPGAPGTWVFGRLDQTVAGRA